MLRNAYRLVILRVWTLAPAILLVACLLGAERANAGNNLNEERKNNSEILGGRSDSRRVPDFIKVCDKFYIASGRGIREVETKSYSEIEYHIWSDEIVGRELQENPNVIACQLCMMQAVMGYFDAEMGKMYDKMSIFEKVLDIVMFFVPFYFVEHTMNATPLTSWDNPLLLIPGTLFENAISNLHDMTPQKQYNVLKETLDRASKSNAMVALYIADSTRSFTGNDVFCYNVVAAFPLIFWIMVIRRAGIFASAGRYLLEFCNECRMQDSIAWDVVSKSGKNVFNILKMNVFVSARSWVADRGNQIKMSVIIVLVIVVWMFAYENSPQSYEHRNRFTGAVCRFDQSCW